MSLRPPGSPEPAEEGSERLTERIPALREPEENDAAATQELGGVGSSSAVATEPAAPPKETKKKSPLRFLRELPVLILIAFVLALLIKSFLVQAFYIPSESMDPTLKVGDRVLVEKLLKNPHRGWVVVFQNPHPAPEPHRNWFSAFTHWLSEGFGVSTPKDEDFIKRVIGLPGETVELNDHGRVFIDGKKLDEPYLNKFRDNRSFGPCEVPADHVFVMGDNRANSNDSRYGFGTLPPIQHGMCTGSIAEDKLVGRAFVIIWPPSHIHWLG